MCSPLFVTWKSKQRVSYTPMNNNRKETPEYILRGCLGTFSPLPLHSGLASFALKSAFQDSRFPPIQFNELPTLQVGISLLTNFEKGLDWQDWEIGHHGIQIDFMDANEIKRSATFLPEVASEQGWNKKETLDSLLRKSGYKGSLNETVLSTLNVTRYQSEKNTLTFDEYIELREHFFNN